MEPHKRTREPSPSSLAGGQAAAEASAAQPQQQLSRYESQKRRDWNSFLRYLQEKRQPLGGAELCSRAHVIDFLRYLDQFGKTKVHSNGCVFYGHPSPTGPCPCPLRQAWGSLDALTGRLRAAYEESGGAPEANPFSTRAVRDYLRQVRESQARARGISYKKKKRRHPQASGGSSPPHVPSWRTRRLQDLAFNSFFYAKLQLLRNRYKSEVHDV
ncbi:hypothetical protein HPP92_017931 [Vanilla planifolia]|uniref:ALOG domain-containing protein n=1 Tax=Vanilla planifolia TaxID=51239 RepID=A0A835Q8Y5_VANPL|nr:hypothetical protein HPP92_017931 [Vanilla planifolia]